MTEPNILGWPASVWAWFDTSPVRPWEWWQIESDTWTVATQVKAAWNAGIKAAADSHRAAKEAQKAAAKAR